MKQETEKLHFSHVSDCYAGGMNRLREGRCEVQNRMTLDVVMGVKLDKLV
jgi:hypothetical protein